MRIFTINQFCLLMLFCVSFYLIGQESSNLSNNPVKLPEVSLDKLPVQSAPPSFVEKKDSLAVLNIGKNTNLIRLLSEIRRLSASGQIKEAQETATKALESISNTEENKFYLNQIRKEETKLYFNLANQAMRDKEYSLASQLLARYRENVSLELEDRKRKRELVLNSKGPSDVSLVGKLVEELDKAKKDLAQIRAKAGLPEDDAKPDFERLMEEEKAKMAFSMRRAENLLLKARKDSSDGQYDLANDQLNEALNILPPMSPALP